MKSYKKIFKNGLNTRLLFFDRPFETGVTNLTKPYKIEKKWLNHAVFNPFPLKDKNSKCVYKEYKKEIKYFNVKYTPTNIFSMKLHKKKDSR